MMEWVELSDCAANVSRTDLTAFHNSIMQETNITPEELNSTSVGGQWVKLEKDEDGLLAESCMQPRTTRPKWVPDDAVTACQRCGTNFTMLFRRHHCRWCGKVVCSYCSPVRASFPPHLQYTEPQRVCKVCMPFLFKYRGHHNCTDEVIQCVVQPQTSPSKSIILSDNSTQEEEEGEEEELQWMFPKLTKSQTHSKVVEGSFLTAGNGHISLPYRMLDPMIRFTFWLSGMYNGGTFNRNIISTAAKARISTELVKSKKSFYVKVPYHYTYPIPSSPPFQPSKIAVDDKTFDMHVIAYTPNSGNGPFPVLVWYHGGGFCLGSIEDQLYDHICRTLCNSVGCVVVNVEYRLAPEFKFPTQIEDSYRALLWVHENASLLNIDPTKIAVGGDSAGGSLTATMCTLAIVRNGPKLSHQLLIYPCLTNPLTNDLPSHTAYKDGPVLTRGIMEWFMSQLFENMEQDLKHPLQLPLHNSKILQVPSATIINARHDPLVDHGTIYAKQLRAAGIPTTHSVYQHSIHGFFGSPMAESSEALMECAAALHFAFGIISSEHEKKSQTNEELVENDDTTVNEKAEECENATNNNLPLSNDEDVLQLSIQE